MDKRISQRSGGKMKQFKFLEGEKKNYCDIFTYEYFMECVASGGFIPYDGSVGDVYVNDRRTNIDVIGWGFKLELADVLGKDIVGFTLEEIGEIKGKVEILWCNK